MAAAACAHAKPHLFDDPEVAALAAQLEEVRGLKFTAHLKVDRLSDRDFDQVYSPAMAAFHVSWQHLVMLRAGLPTRVVDQVLVHEMEHELQDQHFPGIGTTAASPDAQLVGAALAEGDATLAEALWLRARHPNPKDDPLGRLARTGLLSEDSTAADWNANRFADPLSALGLDLLVHEVGPRFLAQVYLSGGLAAVDRMLLNHPTSTAELLHPERYLSGERPLTVAVPAGLAPPNGFGWAPFGELRLRLLLDHCIPHDAAVSLSSGWAGDALALSGAGPEGFPEFRWITAWRSQAQSRRFEEVARQEAVCLTRTLARRESGAPSTPWFVRREGRTVLFDRGLLSDEQVKALLASTPTEFRDEAVAGVVDLPSSPALLSAESPWQRAANGGYVNSELGFTVRPPEGFEAVLGPEGQLILRLRDVPSVLATLSFRRQSGSDLGDVANHAAYQAVTSVRGSYHADRKGWEAYVGPLGVGHETRYRLREVPQVKIHVVVVSVCDKAGLNVVTTQWSRPQDRVRLEALLRSLQVATPQPICSHLSGDSTK